jgi:hypothetical protein
MSTELLYFFREALGFRGAQFDNRWNMIYKHGII